MKQFLRRLLDVVFPFPCVARNQKLIDKLLHEKRRTMQLKTAASNRLRTTIRKTLVEQCDEDQVRTLRSLQGFS